MKKLSKLTSILLAILLIISLAACDTSNRNTDYSGNPEEGQELFFKILMSRNLTPEQRADILMNGLVQM